LTIRESIQRSTKKKRKAYSTKTTDILDKKPGKRGDVEDQRVPVRRCGRDCKKKDGA